MNLDEDSTLVPLGSRFRRLGGFSGAAVLLVEDAKGQHFVRKVARTEQENERLAAQVARLTAFSSVVPTGVRVPDVLSTGFVGDRYFVDLSLVDGLDGVTFLRTASLPEVGRFRHQLVDYLQYALQSPPAESPSSASFALGVLAKVDDLTIQMVGDPEATDLLNSLRVFAGQINYPDVATLCHGDLTLENLIVDRAGHIWMIDQTRPPFEHVWFDISKLEQDLAGGWYLRSHDQLDAGVRSHILGAVRSVGNHDGYEESRSVLVGLTFARILPYTRSAADRAFVRDRIRSALARPRSRQQCL